MSEEVQSHQQTTQQQQQQSQQSQTSNQLPTQPPRLSVHDIRNSDLVSRYMAATPPYLYSSPVGPQNFFFSDMLRSIVQNRNAELAARSANNQTNNNASSGVLPLGRRSRKRAWGSARSQMDTTPMGKESKLHGLGGKIAAEKPLELTNKCHSPLMKFGKTPSEVNTETLKGLALKHSLAEYAQTQQLNNNNNSIHIPPPDSQTLPPSTVTTIPSSDLVLPPPPPMWYPPLYPPYGIDPLHFFIDLRVSGHIYDRKKENTSPNTVAPDDPITPPKPRLGSAFSVPPSRRDNKSPNSRALNLTSTSPTSGPPSDKHSTFAHNIYDHSTPFDKESPLMLAATTKNTNYVLQNLPRIYTDLSSSSQIGGAEEHTSVHSDETTDSKSELDAGQEQCGDDGPRDGIMVDDIVDRDEDDSNDDVVIVDSKHNHDSSSGY